MRRLTIVLIIAAVAVFSATSCSVKEPRGNCPSLVTLNLDKFEALKVSDNAKVTVFSGSKSNRTESVCLSECVGVGHQVLVEKTLNTFSCAVGYEGMECKADSIYCLPGREFCALWRDGFTEEITEDVMYFTMTPHKEYCTVNFEIVGIAPNETYPYDILVKASCNGVRLHDACPISGRFSAIATRPDLAVNTMTVRVPRQQAYDMTMELIQRKEDNPERTYNPEDVMKVYNLGKIMETFGYSWNLEDLEDFTLKVDFSQLKVMVGIEEWSENELSDKI